MKRDMELCRKILFAIEEQHKGETIMDLSIENYTMEQVAYHCKIMYEAGFLSYYEGYYTFEGISDFQVGGLTWEGNDFLDKIREDTIWNKTKTTIIKGGLSMTVDVIKQVSTAILSAMTEGAIKGLLGGQS